MNQRFIEIVVKDHLKSKKAKRVFSARMIKESILENNTMKYCREPT